MRCNKCGADVPEDAKYCPQCAAPQEENKDVADSGEGEDHASKEAINDLDKPLSNNDSEEFLLEEKSEYREEEDSQKASTDDEQAVENSSSVSVSEDKDSLCVENLTDEESQEDKPFGGFEEFLYYIKLAFRYIGQHGRIFAIVVAALLVGVVGLSLLQIVPEQLDAEITSKGLKFEYPREWTRTSRGNLYSPSGTKIYVQDRFYDDGLVDDLSDEDKVGLAEEETLDVAQETLSDCEVVGDPDYKNIGEFDSYIFNIRGEAKSDNCNAKALVVLIGNNVDVLIAIDDGDASLKDSSTVDAIFNSVSVDADSYTITFINDKKTVDTLKAWELDENEGAAVLAPRLPAENGYFFDGWVESGKKSSPENKESTKIITGIKSDMTFNASWVKGVTVIFTDGNGNELSRQTIKPGSMPIEPNAPSRDGFVFSGWDTDFSKVEKDTTVNALWNPLWTVTFVDGNGNQLKTETVENGDAATAPVNPSRDGYIFVGWDCSFDKVESDLTVTAIWRPEPTVSQQNALASATSYLNVMPFSYQGLVKQLEFEKYSHEDAVYAADYCGADWNEQAARAAEDYLDVMSFSRDGLIDQLMFEGYTYDQAVYGVNSVGL